MKRTQRRQSGRNAFDLIEEATQLLRTAPAATLAVYYLGAIPFVLGLLFFWADMSRSPFAPQHLAGASLGMAVLFFWMKFSQAIFARRIRAQAAGEKFLPPDFRRCTRIFFMQAAIQPCGLFLLPLAALPILPFAWVYAFYQNAAALDDGGEAGTAALMKKSWRQAALWPRQNHIALAVMSAFAFCVFLNWTTVCLTLPQLCKMLFGVESDFTRSPFAMLNTTFFAAMFGLTYLCVDPIVKTIFALRCFYGESLQSGEDLKAELKPFINSAVKTAAAIFILLAAFSAAPALAGSTNTATTPVIGRNISPPDLDRAINQTIHERKYVWRMPREQVVQPDADQGIIARFFNKAGEMIRGWARAVLDWLEELLRRLFRHTPHVQRPSSGYGWIMALQILLYGLAAAAIAALVIFLLRVWRNRRRSSAAIASEPIQPAPDLADENVRADQLPEDGWTKLARELLARGEFRLAMRAFYLASLAHLAERNLISIARCKSNREYERELRRRAHSFPNLLAVFGDNISVFERIWYGTHEASGELVHQFAASVEKMKAGG
jgi:hypothetical protein